MVAYGLLILYLLYRRWQLTQMIDIMEDTYCVSLAVFYDKQKDEWATPADVATAYKKENVSNELREQQCLNYRGPFTGYVDDNRNIQRIPFRLEQK